VSAAADHQHQPGYRGRFAPSPTGLLHLGSLFAALASYLRARSLGGQWLVRIEDIDPPREVAGAADGILRQLEAAGLHWDGPVVRQSGRLEVYRQTALRLVRDRHAYRCTCSRREIAAHPQSGVGGTRYPGTCRGRGLPAGPAQALRLLSPAASTCFEDGLQGLTCVNIEATSGDVVIWRKEDLPAYHLAVVVDDAWQGITEVVRGIDLLTQTAPHIHLQQLLGLPVPAYLHLPILINAHGDKLSKQTRARALTPTEMPTAVARCLSWLGWSVPPELTGAAPAMLLQAAGPHFSFAPLHQRTSIGVVV